MNGQLRQVRIMAAIAAAAFCTFAGVARAGEVGSYGLTTPSTSIWTVPAGIDVGERFLDIAIVARKPRRLVLRRVRLDDIAKGDLFDRDIDDWNFRLRELRVRERRNTSLGWATRTAFLIFRRQIAIAGRFVWKASVMVNAL